jgi:hypothetical protein
MITRLDSRFLILAFVVLAGTFVRLLDREVREMSAEPPIPQAPADAATSEGALERWLTAPAEIEAATQADGVVGGAYAPSLEMQEMVDFLLTPPLLIQRGLQAEPTVGYPEE